MSESRVVRWRRGRSCRSRPVRYQIISDRNQVLHPTLRLPSSTIVVCQSLIGFGLILTKWRSGRVSRSQLSFLCFSTFAKPPSFRSLRASTFDLPVPNADRPRSNHSHQRLYTMWVRKVRTSMRVTFPSAADYAPSSCRQKSSSPRMQLDDELAHSTLALPMNGSPMAGSLGFDFGVAWASASADMPGVSESRSNAGVKRR